MNDIDFNPGAIKDTPDIRDFQFGEEIGHASAPFNWTAGYDIEATCELFLNRDFKLKVKDQGVSGSCGGQAWATYGEVWDVIVDTEDSEKSAKFIYAQTHVQPAGSGGRENCDIVIKQGWSPESLCSSYSNGKPGSEEFYQRKEDITVEARSEALKDRAFAYANVSSDIDMIAQAIRDNYGVVLGITGTNNGTWKSKNPKPPTEFANSWNHWVYAGKARIKNGTKQIGFLNSWGEDTGDNGWQWIDEDYFTKRIMGYPVIWSAWTLAVKNEPPVIAFEHRFVFVLKYGMSGDEVKSLQKALQLEECFPLNVNTTTYFGSITLGAVKKFQQKYGLKVDGIVGRQTNEKLNQLFDR